MKFFASVAAVAALYLLQPLAAWAQHLPYTAIHDPQFVPPAQATFLHDEDRVIGVLAGKLAKAYPAAILSQHGLVEDQSPEGPIAITW